MTCGNTTDARSGGGGDNNATSLVFSKIDSPARCKLKVFDSLPGVDPEFPSRFPSTPPVMSCGRTAEFAILLPALGYVSINPVGQCEATRPRRGQCCVRLQTRRPLVVGR